jgi:lipopolysaccharide/colanic/teichoic acid biosynthesis glycosyltransferase
MATYKLTGETGQLTGEAPRLGVEPQATGLRSRWAAGLRRGIDLGGALLLLTLLAPLWLLAAIAIRIDTQGPIVYRQRRLGRALRPFDVCKFRSMRTDADATPHRDYVCALIAGGGPTVGGGRSLYKLAVDDRITRVGRILRRWSLDELPQLWNVVRGEMSLVGPRPVIPYEVERYPAEWWLCRFRVKPGMTGLWQVSGRNEKSYDEMVRLDVEYVERQTILLDLRILAKTAWVVLTGRGVA